MFRKCLLVVGVIASAVAYAASMEWMTDLEKAGEKAAADGKLLLVEFTGSDWCTACKVQKKKVLQDATFVEWAQRYYVPVEVDVPLDAALIGGEQQLQVNKQICDTYGVKIFPTLMVMTPELVVMGECYGSQASPAAAMAALQDCNPAVARFRDTMALPAEQRADALFVMWNQLPEASRKTNFALLRLIAEADADNSTGMQELYRARSQMKKIDAAFIAAKTTAEKLLVLENAMPEILPANIDVIEKRKETLLQVRAMELLQAPASVADIELSRDFALQAVDCIPDDTARKARKKIVEQYYANPESLYRQMKQLQPHKK